jgi:DNA invertase Pin-like site-specific DNA recombinase
MEGEAVVERTQSGFAAARARGRAGAGAAASPRRSSGRQRLYDLRSMTIEQIARAVSSSSATVYRYVPVGGRYVGRQVGDR